MLVHKNLRTTDGLIGLGPLDYVQTGEPSPQTKNPQVHILWATSCCFLGGFFICYVLHGTHVVGQSIPKQFRHESVPTILTLGFTSPADMY